MLPTQRTVWLVAFGLAPIVAGMCASLILGKQALFAAFLPWFMLAYNSAIAVLFLSDGLLAKRCSVRVEREFPGRFSVGTHNKVTLLVENHGPSARLLLRDDAPASFLADPQVFELRLSRRAWVRVVYNLFPTDRGNFRFGDVSVRCRGPLGLAWVDKTLPAGQDFQVYPNLLDVRHYESLVRATLVRSGGFHLKRMPGASREFSHFRDYTPDDDFRHISWVATARRGKPITTVFESEHSQDIIFCLDIGRMMAARVGNLSKLDHAINAILMLTHVSHRFQDNLGLLIFSHTVHRFLPPTKGRAQFAQFLEALYTVKPELSYVNYREAFQYLIARHPKRALTMVFTDLLDAAVSEEYRVSVQLLKRFHMPLTLAVADVPLQELATRVPETTPQLYDIHVARDLLRGRAELLAGLEREGIMVVDTVPERLTIDAVNRYLALKMGM